jgi:predicted anti-sigma-YlaC factor YlaD
MQCLDFESRLQDVLDARESPQADAAIRTHAAECAECGHLLAAMVAVVENTSAAPVACSADVTRRVLQQMRPVRARVLPLRWAVPLAVAAALAAVLPVWSLLSGEHGPAENHAAITKAPAQAAPIEPDRTVAPAGPEIASADAWSLMPEFSDFGVGTNDELKLGFNGVGDEVREGLAPVTRTTAGALESLWQVLSPAEDNRS